MLTFVAIKPVGSFDACSAQHNYGRDLTLHFFELVGFSLNLPRKCTTRFSHAEYESCFLLQVDRNLMLYLPRLTVLVTIVADRPGAWFPGPFGPYLTWFPAICLSRDFKRAKVPGNPMKSPFCFGVFWGVIFKKYYFRK
jgi:hypothetical protein